MNHYCNGCKIYHLIQKGLKKEKINDYCGGCIQEEYINQEFDNKSKKGRKIKWKKL